MHLVIVCVLHYYVGASSSNSTDHEQPSLSNQDIESSYDKIYFKGNSYPYIVVAIIVINIC